MAKNLGTFTPSSQLTAEQRAKLQAQVSAGQNQPLGTSTIQQLQGLIGYNPPDLQSVVSQYKSKPLEEKIALIEQSNPDLANTFKIQLGLTGGKGSNRKGYWENRVNTYLAPDNLRDYNTYLQDIRQAQSDAQSFLKSGVGDPSGAIGQIESNIKRIQDEFGGRFSGLAPELMAGVGQKENDFVAPFSAEGMASRQQTDPTVSLATAGRERTIKLTDGRVMTIPEYQAMLKAKTVTPSGITPETMTPAQSIDIPGGATDTTAISDGLVMSANTGIAELMKQLTPPETEAEQKQQNILDQMAESTGELAQKGADQLTAEQSAGLPELRQQFADINAQILAKTAEYKVLQTANQNKPITMSSILGSERAIMNAQASDIGLLQAQALGLQGQIETAQATVDRAIDLKYSTIQAQLDVYQAQLQALEPTLNKEEKQVAMAQQLLLDERQRALDEEKQQEKDKQNLMIQAINSGITDNGILKQISEAKDFNEAIRLYGNSIPSVGTTGDYSVVNVNGEDMIFDKNSGTLRPTTITESQSSFTDGSGITWNIEGWATDPTKAQQMQTIADRIGKVDDNNIDEKVRQFTPGLTADMIRETSAKTGVSWEALMAMANQESMGGISPVAQKNNNFAGLTWNNQDWVKPYGGTIGTARPSAEGGNYIAFPNKQAGLDAMGALMANYGTVTPKDPIKDQEVQGYVAQIQAKELTLDQALKQVSESKKKDLIIAYSTAPKETDSESTVADKQKLTTIDSILKSGSLNDIVGRSFADTDWGRLNVGRQFGDYWDVLGNIKNVTDQLTLDKLIEAKKAGATFGALSNVELDMLANAATAINNFAMYKEPGFFGKFTPNSNDGKNTLVGFRASEKEFEKQMKIIKQFYQTAIERKGGGNFRTMGDGSIVELLPDGNYKIIN